MDLLAIVFFKGKSHKINCFYMFPALLSKNDIFQAFVIKILTNYRLRPRKKNIYKCELYNFGQIFFLHSNTDNGWLAVINNNQ
jgi:hypothetical protein